MPLNSVAKAGRGSLVMGIGGAAGVTGIERTAACLGVSYSKLCVSLSVGAGTGGGGGVAGTDVGVAAVGNLLRIRGTPNSLILLRVMHRTPRRGITGVCSAVISKTPCVIRVVHGAHVRLLVTS